MSKQFNNKKKGGKGPRPAQNGTPVFSEDTLAQLTSKLDKNLNSSADHKRKNPPADNTTKQDQKRQRNTKEPAKNADSKNADMDLLAEIRALGGNEDDFDLINGIDSEDEEYTKDQKMPVDKKLKAELAAFSKELGLADHVPEDAEPEEDELEETNGVEEEEEEEEESESEEEPESESEGRSKPKFGDMLFEPRADWHVAKLGKLPKPKTDQTGPFAKSIEALKQESKQLLEQDAAKYRSSIFASSSHKFLSTIMTTGTLSDKVSALTLAVQESPVHNIRAFDSLITLAAKKSRAQALGAIGALVDLLGPGTLLPSDRRLRTFQTQPGLLGTLQMTQAKGWTQGQPLPGKMTKPHLIAWAYEDWLKETYFKLIQLLEQWCSDELEFSRTKALDFVYALLKEKPEQESNLLRLLVNKLGDRDRKIASRSSYLLLQLQTSHPGMRPIIIRSIEQEILLHPAQDLRSKYYAINTLNQTILSSKDPKSPEALMRIYFDLFITLLKTGSLGIALETDSGNKNDADAKTKAAPKKGPLTAGEQEIEAADKLVSAVLTGVNRAAPFVGANDEVMEKHVDTLFKIAHSANFNTGIQALLLIQHLSITKNIASDRFYRTLYESLLDPRLITSSKQALYLNLLLRALKSDVDVRRVKAFVKRMLQIAGLHQPPFVCGLLYVVAHLRETFPDLSTLMNDPEESAFDDDAPEERPVYDGKKREPIYANAQRSCLWEMIPAQAHYHPTVSLFAANLSKPAQKVAKPDLDSHSLIRFLDKFVYRNPKTTDSSRGVSIMQPLRATKDSSDIWLGTRAGSSAAPVNSAAFAKQASDKVAAEDVFFHEYFQHMKSEPKKPKAATAEGEEDAQEDEIWKALVASQPDVDIDDDASDLGFDDLDPEDMASDDDSPAMSLDSQMDDDDDDDEMGGVEFNDFDDDEEDDDLVKADDDEEDEEKTEKQKERERKKARRKELKSLPMFASVEDYAELLAQEQDDL
ncbi:CBF-domain-containing protein [Sarocladium strictum]